MGIFYDDSSFSFFITHVGLYISLFSLSIYFFSFLFFIYFSLLYLSICRFYGSCYFTLACYSCLSYLVQNRHSCIFFSMRTFAYLFTFSLSCYPHAGCYLHILKHSHIIHCLFPLSFFLFSFLLSFFLSFSFFFSFSFLSSIASKSYGTGITDLFVSFFFFFHNILFCTLA